MPGIIPKTAQQNFERSLQIKPRQFSTLRLLLYTQRISNRDWIFDQFSERANQEIGLKIESALFPSFLNSVEAWKPYRCQAAWQAWTLGLIKAANHEWDVAITYYQIGLGLAPGNTPENIKINIEKTTGAY